MVRGIMRIEILVFILSSVLASHVGAVETSTGTNSVKKLNVGGSFSINWRNISPREPGYENQIQNQLFISDAYLNINAKINNKYPFLLEFNIPTASQGSVVLYRFATNIVDTDRWKIRIGKFLVPFGQ